MKLALWSFLPCSVVALSLLVNCNTTSTDLAPSFIAKIGEHIFSTLEKQALSEIFRVEVGWHTASLVGSFQQFVRENKIEKVTPALVSLAFSVRHIVRHMSVTAESTRL
jgi:hypothetical protein